MVCNGRHRPRTVTTAAGPVEVSAPRVNDKRTDEATGERKRFSSKILAPWCRQSPKASEVLPLLYLHGLSSGNISVSALEQFLGSAAGLPSATVTRLTKRWTDEHAAFQCRDLAESDYVYAGADGIHPKIRLSQTHSCLLVLMGVRVDGTEEVIAIAEGLRASTESWADVLRDCCRRGMRDPAVVVGDGARAYVGPGGGIPRRQAPKVLGPQNPPCHERTAEVPAARSEEGPAGDQQRRGFPAGDWIQLRTTNPIESAFSTVKLRARVTPGAGSPACALAMVFKFVESAQVRWRGATALPTSSPSSELATASKTDTSSMKLNQKSPLAA